MIANVTWPALIYVQRERAWWMIVATVVVEFLILRRALRTTPARGFAVTFAINLFSAAAGTLLTFSLGKGWGTVSALPWLGIHGAVLPWLGIHWAVLVEQMLNLGTFNTVSWNVTVLLAGLLSTLLEGVLLYTLFYRVATKQCLLWLPLANLASAEVTFLSIRLFWPSS